MPLRIVPSRDRKLNRHIRKVGISPLKKGEILYEAEAPADRVIMVGRGHLRLVTPDRACSPRAVGVVGPWEIAGEEALLPGAVRRYRAVAGEPTTVRPLEPGPVLSALRTSQVTRDAFLAACLDDLAFQHHLNSGRPSAAGRIASVLLHLAGRMSDPADGPRRIPVRLTHQTLADLAGTHRSTVTTILNEWLYDQWLVSDEDGFRLDDVPALLRLAEFAAPTTDGGRGW